MEYISKLPEFHLQNTGISYVHFIFQRVKSRYFNIYDVMEAYMLWDRAW